MYELPLQCSAFCARVHVTEECDGSGYPHGLRGQEIPLAARLFAVVDVWDALRSERPYRKPWPTAQVIAHMVALRNRHFDPEILDIFLHKGMYLQTG